MDKFVRKLTVWNGKNINHAGRSTLVKAVFTSQAVYCLTSLRAPKATAGITGVSRVSWNGASAKAKAQHRDECTSGPKHN